MRNKTTRVHPHNPWRESRAEDRWQPAAAEQRGVLEVGGEGLVASGEDLDEAGELGPSGLARSRSRCKASSSLVIFSSTASSFCSKGLTAVRRSMRSKRWSMRLNSASMRCSTTSQRS